MKITKDYTYLNTPIPAKYKGINSEYGNNGNEISKLIRDFGGKKVFDALMSIYTKADMERILELNEFESFDDFMEQASAEDIYDVYRGAAELLTDGASEEDLILLMSKFGRKFEY